MARRRRHRRVVGKKIGRCVKRRVRVSMTRKQVSRVVKSCAKGGHRRRRRRRRRRH